MGFFSGKKPRRPAKAMANDDADDMAKELARMEANTRQRKSHYAFAHKILPMMIRQDPEKAVTFLAGPRGPVMLAALYEKIRQDAGDEVDIPVAPDDFAVDAAHFGTRPGFVITLPKPIRQAEAHMVAVVFDRPGSELAAAVAIPPLPACRYFTLELGYGRDVLCEWGDDGAHRNFGLSPAVTVPAFVEAVAGRY